MREIDVNRHDPTAETPLMVKPALFKPGVILREEELILCKTDRADKQGLESRRSTQDLPR